ncbi:hypothetical protein [Burkholderia sp. HI2714]|uniref:hypothetical protein n=1 Tax=Burkholderia sp. HI2714 TaxID=2015359 RepID=UPI00117F9E24|nr:hypothetical protein [Burkholderia sp. HI2714]
MKCLYNQGSNWTGRATKLMALKALELTQEERTKLEVMARSRRDWRIRDRSRTILMFSDGVRAKEIARRQELTLEAVYERRYRWLEKGERVHGS